MPQALVYTGNHACINCFCITGNYYHGYACLTKILMYNVYNLSLPLQVLQGTMWILCLCPETSLLWPRQPQLPLFPQSHPHQSGMRMSAVPTTKMWHCQAPLHPLLRLWKRWCQHRLLQSQRLTRRSFIVGWFQNWFIYIYNIYILYWGCFCRLSLSWGIEGYSLIPPVPGSGQQKWWSGWGLCDPIWTAQP
jgi:hypothetical protein